MLDLIRREYVENMSKGVESSLSEIIKSKIGKLTKKQIQQLLKDEEVYYGREYSKENLIECAYNYTNNSLGYQILRLNEIEGEDIYSFYGRLLREFYQ